MKTTENNSTASATPEVRAVIRGCKNPCVHYFADTGPFHGNFILKLSRMATEIGAARLARQAAERFAQSHHGQLVRFEIALINLA